MSSCRPGDGWEEFQVVSGHLKRCPLCPLGACLECSNQRTSTNAWIFGTKDIKRMLLGVRTPYAFFNIFQLKMKDFQISWDSYVFFTYPLASFSVQTRSEVPIPFLICGVNQALFIVYLHLIWAWYAGVLWWERRHLAPLPPLQLAALAG